MAITPLPTLDRTSVNFRENVDTFFGLQLPAFAAEANALQADVNAKQSTASTAADTATTKAGEALASANTANSAKDTAVSAKDTAVSAKLAAEAALDSFDDRYLGAKATAPTLDNDGNALLIGAIYFDTVIGAGSWRAWNGGAWVTAPAANASAVTNTPAGNIAATNVQAALNELDTEKAALAGPALTGVPTAPTAAPGVNTTQLATTAYALAAAALRYGKNNILGAVGQAAGVPTGAVIERGSNANGEYVRWADGTQICTRTYSVPGTGWASISPTGSYSPATSGSFAAAFIAVPICALTGRDAAISARSAHVSYYAASATEITELYMASHVPVVSSSAIEVNVVAIGRWF